MTGNAEKIQYMRDWRAENRVHCQTYRREKYATPAAKIKAREANWRNLYGIEFTVEQYEELLVAQGGVCAICLEDCVKSLAVDHDHKTKTVRGLLCMKCNTALGAFKEDPSLLEKAIAYLKGKGK